MRHRKPEFLLPFLMFSFYSNLFLIAHASEGQQYVCELKTEVTIAGHTSSDPKAHARTIDNKYVFITNGNQGTYINMEHPAIKGQLLVRSDGLKVTLVEHNTSDNLFIATIFLSEKGGLHEIIFSFHSRSQQIEHYYPKQLYGTCQ